MSELTTSQTSQNTEGFQVFLFSTTYPRSQTSLVRGLGAIKSIIARVGKDPECPKEPIILIGHSMGGGAAVSVAKKLNKDGYKVDFLATLDPVFSGSLFLQSRKKHVGRNGPTNVGVMWNWHQEVDAMIWGAEILKAENTKNFEGSVPQDLVPHILLHTELDDSADIRNKIKNEAQSIIANFKKK